MATRLSIIRSVRRREERQQMGDMTSDFTQTLLEVEKQCLLHISQVARREQQVQLALNSVIYAEKLMKPITFDVSEEFACVLWAQNEQKRAVEFLRNLRDSQSAPLHDASKLAAMNACLVRLSNFHTSSHLTDNDIGDVDSGSTLGKAVCYLERLLSSCLRSHREVYK